MSKILFCGEPPMMDFALVKLNGGENLIDMATGEIYSLGSGELTKIITDAGMALNNTIEATLKSMHPSQSLRVQLLVHGHTGFAFQAPMGIHAPGTSAKIKFMSGGGHGGQGNNIITANPSSDLRPGQHGYVNEDNQVSKIIVVGANVDSPDSRNCYIETDPGNIKHATRKDNEDKGPTIQGPGNTIIAD